MKTLTFLHNRRIRLPLAGALLAFLIGLFFVLSPGSTAIDTHENDADIFFSADRRWVVNAGDCVTVSWNVVNVQAVYINGEGHIGQDQADFCVESLDGLTLTLNVHFLDGSKGDYTLQVGLMAKSPEIWALVMVALTLLVMAFLTGVLPLLNRIVLGFAPVLLLMLRWAGLLVAALIIGLLLLELGLRFYFSNYGTLRERQMYIASLEEIRRSSAEHVLPFLNFGLSDSVSNNLGFYGADNEVPKPEGVFRIVAFGDSTTYGLGVASSQAYPAQLQDILRDEYGYTNIEVINAGVPGYSSWNHVVNLAFRVLELQPDLILLYFATFDAQPRLLTPECYRGANDHLGLPADVGVWQMNGESLGPSVLYRYLAINLGWMPNPLDSESQTVKVIECGNEPPPDPPEALAANPPVYFERNIRTMVGIARTFGAEAMLSTWTYSADITPDARPDWWPGVVAEHNGVIRQVAQDMDTLFYDLAVTDFSNVRDYWFGDYLHQSLDGHVEQARRYAAYLVESGILPEPGQ